MLFLRVVIFWVHNFLCLTLYYFMLVVIFIMYFAMCYVLLITALFVITVFCSGFTFKKLTVYFCAQVLLNYCNCSSGILDGNNITVDRLQPNTTFPSLAVFLWWWGMHDNVVTICGQVILMVHVEFCFIYLTMKIYLLKLYNVVCQLIIIFINICCNAE